MAKVLNPFLSTQAKGTVSGLTASKWRGLNSMRGKATPVRRIRYVQTLNRGKIGYLARVWGVLSDVSRQSYRAWAQNHPQPDGFGGTFLMSGSNAFLKLNQVRMRNAPLVAYAPLAPVTDLAIGMAVLTVATGALTGEVKLDWGTNGIGLATDFCEVKLAGPFESAGKFEVAGKFSRAAIVAGNIITLTVSGLAAGKWYWGSVRYIGVDGQVSAALVGQALAKV